MTPFVGASRLNLPPARISMRQKFLSFFDCQVDIKTLTSLNFLVFRRESLKLHHFFFLLDSWESLKYFFLSLFRDFFWTSMIHKLLTRKLFELKLQFLIIFFCVFVAKSDLLKASEYHEI